MGHTYFTPTIDLYRIDESIIPCEPTVLIQKNARIPIMIGVTNTESAFLLKNNRKFYFYSLDFINRLNYIQF